MLRHRDGRAYPGPYPAPLKKNRERARFCMISVNQERRREACRAGFAPWTRSGRDRHGRQECRPARQRPGQGRRRPAADRRDQRPGVPRGRPAPAPSPCRWPGGSPALKTRAPGRPASRSIYVNDNFGRWRSDFNAQVDHCLQDGVRGRPDRRAAPARGGRLLRAQAEALGLLLHDASTSCWTTSGRRR